MAAHTITHPCVTRLTDWAVVNEVEQDRLRLSELAEQFINLNSDKPQIFYIWGN